MSSEGGNCGICAITERIRAGANPDFVAELPHSYVVLGDAQFYRGYCVLLAKTHAREMFALERAEALALCDEVLALAEAIDAITHPLKMNYECLGNAEPHVHWHLFPRYESDELKRAPIWIRPEAERKRALTELDRRALLASLRAEIARRIPEARFAGD